MTEVKIIGKENKESGKQKLPLQFSEAVRPDLIKRAVLALQSHRRQVYGADPRAGKKASAVLSRRRRKYKGSYGKGISRVPRKTMNRRGMQMSWTGAFAPGTIGGRRAHPPTAEKILELKINDKERLKAIRSALSATVNKGIVASRGHEVPAGYPFILSDDFESLNKTKDVVSYLDGIGLSKELERGSKKTVRAGKGKMRGRKYRKSKGPLLVVSDSCSAVKAAKGIPGVDIAVVSKVNVELLAPGTHAGRLTLFTKKAIEKMDKEMLFL